MMSILVGALVFFGLVSFFIFSYKANKSTPVPEGVEIDLGTCEGCKASGGCKFRM